MMEQKSRHNMRQVTHVHVMYYIYVDILNINDFGPIICVTSFSQRASRAGSRSNSRAASRADSSMSTSIHQARFGSRSFISSKSNLMSSSRKNLASDSMRFQKPVAQVCYPSHTSAMDIIASRYSLF